MGDNLLAAGLLAAAVRRLNLAAEEQRDAEEKVREAVAQCLATGSALEAIAEALAELRGASPASWDSPRWGGVADGPSGSAEHPAEQEVELTPERRRELILGWAAEGLSQRAVAVRADCSPSYVRKVLGAAPSRS